MKEYLTSILIVSAVTAVLGILPTDERLRRTVSFALSLTVLSTVLLPLPTLLGHLDGFSDVLSELESEGEASTDWLEGETLAATADGIRSYLVEEYGLKEDEIAVSVEGDLIDSTVILRRITLRVTGRAAAADIPGIVRALEKDTGAKCEVIYPER